MKVVLYGTPVCSWCKIAKKYFDDRNIVYTYIDVSKDELARNLIVEKTGQLGVPVINIDGTYIVGFNLGKIENFIEGR